MPLSTLGTSYLKVSKLDRLGNSVNISALEEFGTITIKYSDSTVYEFIILDIVENSDHFQIQVLPTTTTPNKDNNIDNYPIFSASISSKTFNYAVPIAGNPIYQTVPFDGGTSSDPVEDDSWDQNTTTYTFGKMPNKTLQWRLSGSFSAGVGGSAGFIQFAMVNGTRGFALNPTGSISPSDGSLFGNNTTIDGGGEPTYISVSPTNPTSIDISGSFRADLASSGSEFTLKMIGRNIGGSIINFPSAMVVNITDLTLYLEFANVVKNVGGSYGIPSAYGLPAPGPGAFDPADFVNSNISSSDVLIILEPLFNIPFYGSDYDALINNYNDNRPSSYLMEVDYSENSITPVNRLAIIERTATRAQVPDSNYTAISSIRPKYLGTKISSADYNTYSRGDISYGKVSVIDKNPIYFARFALGKENIEKFGTFTFALDKFIPANKELAQGGSSVDGVNNTLTPTSDNELLITNISTFEQGRQLTYKDQPSSTIIGLNYPMLENTPLDILFPGIEYKTLVSNEKDKFATFDNRVDKGITSYLAFYFKTGSLGTVSPPPIITDSDGKTFATSKQNFLILDNDNLKLTSSTDATLSVGATTVYTDGALQIYHSYNYTVKNNISFWSGLDENNNDNYFSFSPNQSNLSNFYSETQTPFIVERGDIIRYSYNGLSGSANVEFTVTEVTSSRVSTGPLSGLPLYDTFKVTPLPSTISDISDSGSFTIFRMVENDQRVIVKTDIPTTGSITGFIRPGFLIPKDLSFRQKEEVSDIIKDLS